MSKRNPPAKRPEPPPADRETRQIPAGPPVSAGLTAALRDAAYGKAVLGLKGTPVPMGATVAQVEAAEPTRGYVGQGAALSVRLDEQWSKRLDQLATWAGVDRDHFVELLLRRAWTSQDRRHRGTP